MRNIGIVFILFLIGMSIWKAAEMAPPAQPARVASAATDPQPEAETPLQMNPGRSTPPLAAEKFSLHNRLAVQSSPVQPVNETANTESNPARTDLRNEIEQEPIPEGSAFERIIIPSIKVNAKIITKSYSDLTWDLSNLGQDVAALEDVPTQTTNNNLVFAGHVTVRDGSHGPFRYLFRLVPGDIVLLEDEDFIYTYSVRDQILVYPDESSVLNDTPHLQLTLITCTTYDEETSTYLRRRVIFADLEEVESKEVFVE